MKNYTKGNTILKIEDVSLALGGHQILKNVNAEVKDILRPGVNTGQIVGFLGPSGIGKTKLFEIMAGLLQPTSGSVQIGESLEPVKAGKIGVVQQNYPLFMHRSVESNLLLAAKKQYSDAEAKERTYAMLDRFRLRDKAQLYPAQLSGGQRQRIAIAQQLLCTEHYLLLDEPFSGLDVLMVEEVSETIAEIANSHEQNTVIIVSHDITASAAIADTLWLMGRDHDTNGQPIAGAYIKHTFDLLERDLCWQKNILDNRIFQDTIKEVRALFHGL